MNEFGLLLVFLFGSAAITIIAERQTGLLDFRHITVLGMFVLTYSLNLIGGVTVFIQNRHLDFVILSQYLAMLFLGYIGFCAGAVISAKWMHFRKKETKAFLCHEQLKHVRTDGLLFAIFLLLGAAGVMLLLYIRIVSVFPLGYLFSGEVEGALLKTIRAQGYKGLPQYVTHPMNFFRMTVFPYLLVVCFLLVRVYSAKKWRKMFWLVLCGGIIFNGYSTALYPVALLFAVVLLAGWATRSAHKSDFVLLAIGGLAVPIAWALLVVPWKGLWEIAAFELSRLFLRYTYDIPKLLLSYVEIYIDSSARLLGSAHRPFAIILGLEPINVANEVFVALYPEAFELGYASVPFIGYLYADFGLAGVTLGAVFLGGVLTLAHIIVVRRQPNVSNFALYVMVVWAGYAVPAASITTGLTSKGFLTAFLLPPFVGICQNFCSHIVPMRRARLAKEPS